MRVDDLYILLKNSKSEVYSIIKKYTIHAGDEKKLSKTHDCALISLLHVIMSKSRFYKEPLNLKTKIPDLFILT
jgi:hypothetical protein